MRATEPSGVMRGVLLHTSLIVTFSLLLANTEERFFAIGVISRRDRLPVQHPSVAQEIDPAGILRRSHSMTS